MPVVLDPAGGTPPLFASSGATMTIVWGSGDYLGFDLVSRTVRTFDELAVAATRDVTKSFPLERGVQLADGPAGALAVWRDGYPNPSILASIVNRAPATIAPAGAFDLQTPVAARGRDAFLVAWREQAANSYRLLARRVAFDGTPIDATPIVLQAGTNSWFYGARMPSIFTPGTSADTKVSIAAPRARAAYARPCPKLPAVEHTHVIAGSSLCASSHVPRPLINPHIQQDSQPIDLNQMTRPCHRPIRAAELNSHEVAD